MIAAHHGKKAPRVGKSSLLDVFYPRSINADRNFVLRFAGDGAGVAAYTFAVIDDKSEIHKF
jgi:hypothetical protein